MKKTLLSITSSSLLTLFLVGCGGYSHKLDSSEVRKGINDYSIEDQQSAISKNPEYFRYIENPTEEIKENALSKAGYLIKYVKNPNEKLKRIALERSGSAIKYIKNPSEELQLLAVNKGFYSVIEYINEPSEAVQLAAVKKDFRSFQYIKNPSESVQLVVVKQHGDWIKRIKDPSEAVQLAAIKQNVLSFDSIKNPTKLVQKEAVKSYGWNIQFIKNPSEEIQLLAIKNAPYSIKHIQSPTEKVKKFAKIQQNILDKKKLEAKLKKAKEHYYKAFDYENNPNIQPSMRLVFARNSYANSAGLGFDKAQVKLADMFITGEGGSQNFKKARELYLKAAEQGNEKAKSRLNNFDSLISKYSNVKSEKKAKVIHYNLPSFCYNSRLSIAQLDHCNALKKGTEEAHRFIELTDKYGDNL